MILYCSRCGRPYNGSRVCQNCGTPFDDNDIRAVLQDQKKKSNANTGIIIAVVVIIVFLFVVLIGAAIFVPALIGYKQKRDENLRRAELAQRQNESAVISEYDEREDQDSENFGEDIDFAENNDIELSTSSGKDLSGFNLYKSGNFEVGKDVPAGKYLVFSDDPYGYGDFCFGVYSQSDCSEESELSFEWYQGNAYVILNEGTFIHFSHSNMYKVDEDDILLKDLPDVNKCGGMYEVGKDIEPGNYKLEKTNDQYSMTYSVYSSIDTCSPEKTEEHYSESDSPEVSLSDGEYLLVKFGKPVKVD